MAQLGKIPERGQVPSRPFLTVGVYGGGFLQLFFYQNEVQASDVYA